MVFIRAITRTKGRLIRLYETVSDEYNRTHRYFESYGTSLHLPDIFRRGSITGLAMILVIAAATIPMILYYHGLSNPMLFVYFIFELFCCFWLFFFLVWIAHLLWALAYSVGSKIGGSRFLWGYIEKRWGAQIDKITDELMAERREESVGNSADRMDDEER